MNSYKIKKIIIVLLALSFTTTTTFAEYKTNYFSDSYVNDESVLILNPVVSADGKKVLFEKNNAVDTSYLYFLNTGENPKDLFNPQDIKRKDYDRNEKIRLEILVTETFKNRPESIQIPLGYSFSPAPKCDKIVYAAIDQESNYKICIYDIEKRRNRKIFEAKRCYFPSWAPAGDRIALITAEDDRGQVCILKKVNGKDSWKIEHLAKIQNSNDQYVQWSEDGEKILIVSEDMKTVENSIWLMTIKDKKRKRLEKTNGAEYPVWVSPSKISYFKGKRIFIQNIINNEIDEIVKNAKHIPSGPCWTEDNSLFYIYDGFYKGYESPLVKFKNGNTELIYVKSINDAVRINKPISNGRFLIWNKIYKFFFVVGVYHAYAYYLYALY